ncbi:MAG: transcription elongation factor GreA [Deltaproteobacteria bacterium GWA2_45_12]|nr:MAG: transcription elongation factor GreA [Deltaproteobacteria bacterium GWA2_45_12]
MSAHKRVPMTREGVESLREEISRLKSVERPRIVKELEEARAHGDLSENAEYHAAREKLGHVDGRIQDLEGRLGLAEVIDPVQFRGEVKVMFSAKVTLLDTETDIEETYQIVGDFEANIPAKKISVSSPIARAVIGKKVEDTVKVKTPKGVRELEIVAVEYE